jgi:hypothetical protein
MAGTLQILRLGADRDQYDRVVHSYQVNYTTAGDSYVRVYDDKHLADFLKTVAVLDAVELTRVNRELEVVGSTTVADVDIPLEEAAALGMERVPSDY